MFCLPPSPVFPNGLMDFVNILLQFHGDVSPVIILILVPVIFGGAFAADLIRPRVKLYQVGQNCLDGIPAGMDAVSTSQTVYQLCNRNRFIRPGVRF